MQLAKFARKASSMRISELKQMRQWEDLFCDASYHSLSIISFWLNLISHVLPAEQLILRIALLHSMLIWIRSVKLASPKLFRALDFSSLNFLSYAVWLVLTWQSLQYHTKLLSQYFGMVLKQLPRQNKSNSTGRKNQGGEIQGPE